MPRKLSSSHLCFGCKTDKGFLGGIFTFSSTVVLAQVQPRSRWEKKLARPMIIKKRLSALSNFKRPLFRKN